MKHPLALIALLLAVLLPVAAEESAPDTVWLKDGSILKGTITSLSDTSLRIVTTADLDLTIAMDKVERFQRGEAAGDGAGTTAARDAAAPLMEPLAFEVNLLGLLQFGPYARLHVEVAPGFYLSPHVRIGLLGALNYVFWGGGGFGAGLSALWFLPSPGPNRLYAGAFTEAGVDFEGDFVLVVGSNAGYRWRFPNGSYWSTGAIAGVSYDFWDEYLFFAGMLELGWGWEF